MPASVLILVLVATVIAVAALLATSYAAGYFSGGNAVRRESMSSENNPQILGTWHDDGGFSK